MVSICLWLLLTHAWERFPSSWVYLVVWPCILAHQNGLRSHVLPVVIVLPHALSLIRWSGLCSELLLVGLLARHVLVGVACPYVSWLGVQLLHCALRKDLSHLPCASEPVDRLIFSDHWV